LHTADRAGKDDSSRGEDPPADCRSIAPIHRRLRSDIQPPTARSFAGGLFPELTGCPRKK